jgi:hypothetical protein
MTEEEFLLDQIAIMREMHRRNLRRIDLEIESWLMRSQREDEAKDHPHQNDGQPKPEPEEPRRSRSNEA